MDEGRDVGGRGGWKIKDKITKKRVRENSFFKAILKIQMYFGRGKKKYV